MDKKIGRRKFKKKKLKCTIEKEKAIFFLHYLFNFLVSNFSPIVCISIVVTVIKHFGNGGDFLFLKPPCQYKAPELN